MSLHEYLQAIPKVELNVRLIGTLKLQTLKMITNQNNIVNEEKNLEELLTFFDDPDVTQIETMTKTYASWIRYPEDVAHIVYDMGVSLSKQNVKYAEVTVVPNHYLTHGTMSFEVFLDALNDGRDRAERGWGVKLNWILAIPRDNPRVGDDVARWVTGSAGKSGNVVAIGLIGNEDVQPIGQFRRPFQTAQKKFVGRVAQLSKEEKSAENFVEALEELEPERLDYPYIAGADDDVKSALRQAELPVQFSIARDKAKNEFPLQSLFDDDLRLVLGAEMPTFYGADLTDEYRRAVEDCDINIEDLETIMLNSIHFSYLDEDDKETMLTEFKEAYQQAQDGHLQEHLTEETRD